MFDAQSLLGGLLKEVTKGSKKSSGFGSKAALGMGALGVAIAAYEHFTQEKNNSAQTVSGGSIPPAPSAQRSAPPPVQPAAASAPPPPPPTSAAPTAAPPPAPSGAISETDQTAQQTALLLIDAMLAAANADGHIDDQEKSKIMQQLTRINSDQDGFDYVQARIDNPPSLAQICNSTSDVEIAKQLYMVSLLAITVDTAEEADYINNLASCLPIDTHTISQLNEQFQTKE